MAVVDREGTVVDANPAFGELLGAVPEELAGAQAADLVDLASDARTWHSYREVLRGRQARLRCKRRLKHPDGHSMWAQITITPLAEGSQGSPGVLLSVADITARRELQARLRHLQMHDPVTRLPNRTLFFERLTAALEPESYEQGGTGRIGLCYLDLDGFQAVNDTLGHRVGDRLLAAVAERLTRCADEAYQGRATAPLVARLGGDEFALLVEDSTGTEQLADLAESLLKAVQAPFDVSGHRMSVSASIGVVERQAEGTSATGLMQAADTTLYWAKADGRDRWTLFDPERNAHRMTRQALASTLRPAIERGEFQLEYQPLVGMEDGRPARGRGTGALEPPAVRDADAESVHRTGRGGRLDRPAGPLDPRHGLPPGPSVAARPPRRAADLRQRQCGGPSGLGLRPGRGRGQDPRGNRPGPHLLQLELTESAVMGSAGRPLQALQALSDMGVGIAIDDFGTGYSNLAYLSRLPVSVLKLDGSFVRGFQYEGEGVPRTRPTRSSSRR